jgi:hypothetical protein
MLEILNNPWAVGIGGGILSGLAVTVITRVFLEKKDDRELLERVTAANKELIYAIRPCIAEGSIPSLGVIDSLIAATSRKYRLPSEKLSTSRQLIDDLIKEVMDSSFISASTKADYCAKLNSIFETPVVQPTAASGREDSAVVTLVQKASRDIDRELRYKEYRQRLLSMASMMMGLMAAVMTVTFAFLDIFKDKEKTITLEPLKVLLPVMATIMAVTVTVFATRVASRISTRRVEKKRDHTEDDDDVPKDKEG